MNRALLIIIVIIALAGAGVAGWFYRDALFVEEEVTVNAPVVQELRQMLQDDAEFSAALDDALAQRPEDNYWYGKDANDLLRFFDEWAVFLPPADVEQARSYDDNFGDFYSQDRTAIEPAKTLVRSEPLMGWLKEFVLARGEFMDSAASAAEISAWTESPLINMDDYVVPGGGYASFNEFFTRELAPGARPVDSPDDDSVVTSPADCEITSMTFPLTGDTGLEAKGMSLTVSELLNGDPVAEEFVGGTAASFGLGVTDYHHFHAPVSGRITGAELVDGLYFGLTTFDEFFSQNHRGYYIIETEEYGKVVMIPIGITTISSVVLSKSAGDEVAKGDELGNFAYGGSAILVLFQEDRFTLDEFEMDEHILMGQRVGNLK